MSFFGICFLLYFFKLSAGHGFLDLSDSTKACVNVWEKTMLKMVYKHFSDLCRLHLKKMRKLRQFSAHAGISSSVS